MFRGTVSVAIFMLMFIGISCSDSLPNAATDAGLNELDISGINLCPMIVALEISPLVVGVGGKIDLRATIADEDDASSLLKFRWFAKAGVLSDPYSLETTYNCVQAGLHAIVFTVSDSLNCYDYKNVSFRCVETD